jgi:hypothetical protein
MNLRIPFAFASALLIAGCASAPSTEYQRAAAEGDDGWTTTPLQSDRWRVTYRLDGDDVALAQDLALLRAAELSLEHEHPAFVVVDRTSHVDDEVDRRQQVGIEHDRQVTRECGLLGCSSRVTPTTRIGTSTGTYRRDGDTLVVLEIRFEDDPETRDAYRAAELARTLRARTT